MLEISDKAWSDEPAALSVTLPFGARQKSRQRVLLSSGEEAALLMPRGTVLRGGDRLRASDGRVVEVRAADEGLSVARGGDGLALARAAYHLGNRHVSLQIEAEALRYLHDHVLDQMVRELGLEVRLEQGPFEPEAGAYASGGHGHSHDHGRGGHG